MPRIYSQNDEQTHILKALASVPVDPKDPPRFLDIGAADGVTFSNTRALAELGWAGVLVEASPLNFVKLYQLYRDQPNYGLVLGAVGRTRTIADFHLTDDFVSTLDPEQMSRWKDNHFRTIHVPTFPIHDIAATVPPGLTGWKPYDFISVDVEGLDLEVLHQISALGWIGEARVICVEYGEHEAAFRALLNPRHYEVIYKSGENLVFLRP